MRDKATVVVSHTDAADAVRLEVPYTQFAPTKVSREPKLRIPSAPSELMPPREDHHARPLASSPARVSVDVLQDPVLLRRLLRAKDRMDAASHEAWPVKRLAEVSGVTEAHFARSFKRAFGVPPHRYLLTRRIEQAATLLRDTALSITEIAFATGWESLGTFGRTFHDITGKSPSAMRVEAQANMPRLESMPACVVKAAQRPDLTIAVLEKRRRAAGATVRPSTREVS